MTSHLSRFPVFYLSGVIATFLTGPVSAGELYDAAKTRDVGRVSVLVNSGADPNQRSPYDGPLHVAARLGPREMVVTLLEAGADMELAGYGGVRPLHAAVLAGQTEIVSILLERGAKVDALDNLGRTPLMTLVAGAVEDAEALKALLAAGADPNLMDGATHLYALHYAAKQGSVDQTALLVAAGANVNAKASHDGQSPLHYAMGCGAMRGTQAVVQFLIDHGADVNAKDVDGMTPLDYARRYAPNNGFLHQILNRAGARGS